MNEMNYNLEVEEKKKRIKKIWRLGIIVGISSFMFIFSTYAWFVGITTVNVSQFDVKVEAMDGLKISASPVVSNFDNSMGISKDNFSSLGNAVNSFGGNDGITPLSSSGLFSTTGHLQIFKNTSISATKGGYKIRASSINNQNDGAEHDNGYVVFDMFIKNTTNTSGTLPSYTYEKNEGEDIYLTSNSRVNTVAPAEGNDYGEGLEYSVRVAFYEVGYVPINNVNNSKLESIGCSSADDNKITGLCNTIASISDDSLRSYLWNIWEPNDNNHLARGILNYNNLCKVRQSDGNFASDAVLCKNQPDRNYSNNGYINTYSINSNISSDDNVINYDGHNGYTSSKLSLQKTYKSSLNTVAEASNPYSSSVTRTPFLRLAPNSITRVRVYIWLEGQDIDSVDFSGAITRKISVSFGFTKDKYEAYRTPNPSPAA